MKIEKKKTRLNSVGSLSFLCWTADFKERGKKELGVY